MRKKRNPFWELFKLYIKLMNKVIELTFRMIFELIKFILAMFKMTMKWFGRTVKVIYSN